MNSLTCNEGFEKFHKFLVDTIYKLCPEKQIKVRGKRKRYDPWITKGIQHSISKQKRLYGESINHVATGKTNEYKAKLQSIIHKSKQSYLISKCTEYQRNAKQGSQFALCRAVSCTSFHVVTSTTHGVHMDTT